MENEKNEAFEYAIRKDVRNNPIVREVDERRQKELWHSIGIGCVTTRAGLARATISSRSRCGSR